MLRYACLGAAISAASPLEGEGDNASALPGGGWQDRQANATMRAWLRRLPVACAKCLPGRKCAFDRGLDVSSSMAFAFAASTQSAPMSSISFARRRPSLLKSTAGSKRCAKKTTRPGLNGSKRAASALCVFGTMRHSHTRLAYWQQPEKRFLGAPPPLTPSNMPLACSSRASRGRSASVKPRPQGGRACDDIIPPLDRYKNA